MGNSLFDSNAGFEPQAPAGRDKLPPSKATARPLTVTQVAQRVRLALAETLPPKLRVIGEVSNFSGRQHWFFSLKDEKATLGCVCFASAVRRVGFPLADGMQVVATGRIDYYDTQGRLQFYVDRIEPVGQGALELQFRALCDQLRRLGYFDPAHKKALPVVPRRVAVVTSRAAAALQDVIHTAAGRWAGCRLMLFDVRVQGDEAPPQIAAAIRALSRDGPSLEIDAILLTRGGGSVEDLWAFNERIVADAIFECSLPIVAAIGHETDTTIAELVADVRCATPTQAVMALIPDRQAMEHQLYQLTQRLIVLLKKQYRHSEQRFQAVVRHPIFRRPESMFELVSQRLHSLAKQLEIGLPRRLKSSRDRLEALARQLEAVGPANVLKRGYTYTLDSDGKVIRSVVGVRPGTHMTTVWADGMVESQVHQVPNPPSSKGQTRSGGEGSSTGLFDDA